VRSHKRWLDPGIVLGGTHFRQLASSAVEDSFDGVKRILKDLKSWFITVDFTFHFYSLIQAS
jgi:hypothetical protein